VIKVAKEVGTQGVLGGQAEVANVQGIWHEITYVSHPSLFSLLRGRLLMPTLSCIQNLREHDGVEFDDSSAWVRADQRCGDGWRLYEVYHHRSFWSVLSQFFFSCLMGLLL
jgi:hypothetical protein